VLVNSVVESSDSLQVLNRSLLCVCVCVCGAKV